MKQFLSILVLGVGIFSCKSKNNNEQKITDTLSVQHEEHQKEGESLQLNKGAKWKVDSNTTINIGLIKKTIATTLNQKSIDFTTVAGQLQEDLNKLISECKMTGADHEALHQWLEPLLEKVKNLKEATAVTGPTLLKEISDHLNLFANYFE